MAWLTGKGHADLAISLRHLGLDDTFDMVVTSDDVAKPKPHPEGLYAIANGLLCDVNGMIMIGDSDADVEAAHQAGIRSVCVSWFATVFRDFRAVPDDVCTSVEELRRLLSVR